MNNGSICGQLVMTFSLEHFSLGTVYLSHETCSNVKREQHRNRLGEGERGHLFYRVHCREEKRKKETKKVLLEILVSLQSSLCDTPSTPKYFCV